MDGQSDRLLTPGEVAALFRVDPKTVTRWAAQGRIGSIRTPGGHRRYRESEVRAILGIALLGLDEGTQRELPRVAGGPGCADHLSRRATRPSPGPGSRPSPAGGPLHRR
jgi:excisionase family DNA binding protein